MKTYIVYMHISPSKKKYIGITSLPTEKRWKNGNGYKKQPYFHRAINKYGWDNFQHIIIARGLSEEDAKAMIVRGFAYPISKELPVEYAVEMNNLINLELEGAIG